MVISQKTEMDSMRIRKYFTAGAGLALTTGSIIGLNELWYKNYPRTRFQFFNDNNEWLQMDKAGHLMSSYTISRMSYEAMKWSGYSENTCIWLGGSVGLIYLSGIEILDGKSAQWGFSWGDQIANFSGSTLFILQQKFFQDQFVTLKFSYSNSPFAMLSSDQLGRNFQQRILKDYNGQTYWASCNISRFLASDADFPSWLNVAIGYGASGMTGANFNVNSVNNFQRTREFYLSFDADLNKIRWPRKWMKTAAKILSFIKLPSPTLEMRSDGKVKMHALFF